MKSDLTNKPPGFRARDPLPLAEYPPKPEHEARFLNKYNSYLRVYMLGECSVLVTREFRLWHLSISHPRRDPTWGEISEARYRVIPAAATMVMLLPPEEEYVNIHPHCYQLIQSIPDQAQLRLFQLALTAADDEAASYVRDLWHTMQGD